MRAMSQRLEVALMLDNKSIYADIASKTGASTATISRVNRCLQYGSGGYTTILKRIREEEQTDEL
jgi:TrpR-related protein YerC/YecD